MFLEACSQNNLGNIVSALGDERMWEPLTDEEVKEGFNIIVKNHDDKPHALYFLINHPKLELTQTEYTNLLCYAVRNWKIDMLKVLLTKYGLSIWERNENGKTPYELAEGITGRSEYSTTTTLGKDDKDNSSTSINISYHGYGFSDLMGMQALAPVDGQHVYYQCVKTDTTFKQKVDVRVGVVMKHLIMSNPKTEEYNRQKKEMEDKEREEMLKNEMRGSNKKDKKDKKDKKHKKNVSK
ncbi:Ankyrin-repeat protein [Orpheovirus IHUMI-LCC2]|uniref:Ankyrin-repeat protein n=1 Tax=Orpheovirus IHUMI-LCC2 TaxID=2023057 RepID=A0A2I2L460_9VIRU|nr:Ankyrin-repeat protein [Orpheovirus IHUMI-LCC2]SNW62332.1 Ankyrin-repeat protein [Orpheovirus IHUMI-LCC2]